jgi:DNA-binding NarL/FixJ family response regulator
MSGAIRVLIVDDQPLMRAALSMSLAAESDIAVVGEAEDGLQAIDLADRLDVDVVVTDIRMPGLDGVSATRRLADPATGHPRKVLVITTFDLDEYVIEALRAGASGFLLKDATALELVQAVRTVAAGEALIDPQMTRRLLDRFARALPPATAVQPVRVPAAITRRENEVLTLVATGLSNAEIGRQLHLAESSVKTHVGHLLAKLELPDRVHLVIYAYDAGLVRPNHAATRQQPGSCLSDP